MKSQFLDQTHKNIFWALMDTAPYSANTNIRFTAWVDTYPETPQRGMTLTMRGTSGGEEVLEMVSAKTARALYHIMRTLYRAHRRQEMKQQIEDARARWAAFKTGEHQ